MPEVRYIDFTSEGVHKRRRKLPHWEAEGVAYFVTFRLADSLPKDVQDRAKEYQRTLDRIRLRGSEAEIRRAERDLFRYSEAHLDKGFGSCCLFDPRAAGIVWESLHFKNGIRYHLSAAAVMPNHVHVVFSMLTSEPLDAVTHTWKSYTSNRINKLLGRSGRLWEPESFDHIVRSPASLARFIRYVAKNPRKAHLDDWPWVMPQPSGLSDTQDSG